MEVGILFCKDCFFSQRAEAQLGKALDSMLGSDRQNLNLVVQTFDIKDLESHSKATQMHRVKVQIVILSQHFLDRLRHDTNVKKRSSPIVKILRPKRVIAILLSVTSDEIIEGFQEYLIQFPEWSSIELKSSNKLDPEFYKKFSEQVQRIYNAELSSTLSFSIFPKKITKDQPKVIILFKVPLDPSDKVVLDLSRGRQRERINEVMMTNTQAGMFRIPSSMCEDRSSLIEITVYVNSKSLGTKVVKFEHNLTSTEDDVLHKISLLLPGFRKTLDDHISQQLSRNFRSSEDFTQDSSLEIMNEVLISREDDFPTAMHFAVNYGLEQTVCVLLYEGDGLKLSAMKNDIGETAIDLALEKGFGNIGQTIKEFSEMTNTFGALQFIRDLCDRHSEELERLSMQPKPDDSPIDARDTEQVDPTFENGDPPTKPTHENENPQEPIYSNEIQVEPIYANQQFEAPQVSNPHYMLLSGGSEGTNEIEVQETVTISAKKISDDVDSAGAGLPKMRKSEIENKISEKEKNALPEPGIVNPHATDCATESGSDSLSAARSLILQSYDVPPPPVVITKPPRKILATAIPLTPPRDNYAYDVPRGSLNNHYCHIPLTQPLLPAKPAIKFPKPTVPVLSIKSNLVPIQSSDGYICVDQPNPGIPETLATASPKAPHKPVRATKPNVEAVSDSSGIQYPPVLPPVIQFASGLSRTGFLSSDKSPLPLTKQFSLDSTQEELLELMNDFKNNVYNLRELELLYENWKQRNDVQRDFKARQKELKEIQKEYRQIQEKIRRETKKTGPISKLLKLIPGSRKKISVTGMDQCMKDSSATPPPEPPTPPILDDPERKVSETSTSDRSTLSEASVPDSGIISEADSGGLLDYIPPSQVPLKLNEAIPANDASPARPPKKPSVTTPPAFELSKSHTFSTDPEPSVLTQSIKGLSASTSTPEAGQGTNNFGGQITNGTGPPAPPPRPMQMGSPFSYINYDGKTKGLPRTNTSTT